MKNQWGILTKSDRAIYAEENGRVTYSKLKSWQKRAVDCGAVCSCEWHHTGACANITYYYDLEDFADLKPEDFKPIKNKKVEQADLSRIKIKIIYDQMVGGFTVKRKKFEEVEKVGLDVRKKDNVIIGAEGRKLSSNNKKVVFYYKKPHSKIWKEVTKLELQDIGYKFD